MDDSHEFKQTTNDISVIYEETVAAMDDEEGCIVEGTVIINKVPGNFHLSTHAFGEVVQRIYMYGRRLDFSHRINHLSFGDDTQMKAIQNTFGEKFSFDMDNFLINQD